MRGKEKMIGFYNYSVILTYIGLVSSVFGITQVFENHMSIAFLCLLLSGICDLFDGKIARSMKNRTEHEKVFGIQIDNIIVYIGKSTNMLRRVAEHYAAIKGQETRKYRILAEA